jgi:hypothetical protein
MPSHARIILQVAVNLFLGTDEFGYFLGLREDHVHRQGSLLNVNTLYFKIKIALLL